MSKTGVLRALYVLSGIWLATRREREGVPFVARGAPRAARLPNATPVAADERRNAKEPGPSDRAGPTPRDHAPEAAAETDRGRAADAPTQIPARGWKDILLRTKDEIAADNLGLIAAGTAFFAVLALFPATAALVSLDGLISDPADVAAQVQSLASLLPAEALAVLQEQLHRTAEKNEGALSLGALVGLALALWSANSGVKTMFTALNVAYDENETRGFIRLNLTSLAVTIGAILLVIVALFIIAIAPHVLGLRGPAFEALVGILRWSLLAAIVFVAIALLYRFGPSRDPARWRWLSWGAGVATLLWMVGSALFSWYAANFEKYDETYGSIGAAVGLLMWFYISVFVVLIGTELNAELERRTARDTTRGPDRPMGAHAAHAADTLGEAKGKS